MVSDGLRDGLVQLSCVLSMVGSGLVILTWAYPKKNRVKQGRILLLWLSLSDFLSSCIYFIQTFHPKGDDICEVNALLGIYFPVASFLWTDCIAFFIYLVVTNRNFQPLNWPQLLRNFHIFVWSTSLLVIILVYSFGHAGYANTDDGNDGTNTGGWCWIKGDNPTERFIWEVIGGKFIEWVSCLIVLPYLYYSVYQQLSSVEGLQDAGVDRPTVTSTGETQDKVPTRTLTSTTNTTTASQPTQTVLTERSTQSPVPKARRSIESLFDMSGLSQNDFIEQLSSERASLITTTDPTVHTYQEEGQTIQERRVSRDQAQSLSQRQRGSHGSGRNSASNGFFNQFYYKLAAVPIVLFLIRVWSSLRIILHFAHPHSDNGDSFFEVMQALFDPSQGIFNALLFVLASPEDRHSMFDAFDLLFRRIKERFADLANLYCIGNICSVCCMCCVCCADAENPDSKSGSQSSGSDLQQRLILPGGTRSKANSNSTGHSLLDTSDDFECDSSERMSDFSFDMTDTLC